jgi:hypothetical protein
VFGLLAVYYWFRASTVTVTDADKRYDPDHKADDINFLATAKEQSRFNRIAATYTALAIISEPAVSAIV